MHFKTSQDLFDAGYCLMVYDPVNCVLKKPSGELTTMRRNFYTRMQAVSLDGVAVRAIHESQLADHDRLWRIDGNI